MEIGFIAYIALSTTWALSGQEVRALYNEMFEAPRVEIGQITEKSKNAWILRVGETEIAVVRANERLRLEAYEYALLKIGDRSVTEAMDKHTSFIMVASLGKPKDHGAALNAATAVTLITAALANRPPSSAVLFSSSDLLLPPFAFVDVALTCRRQNEPASLIWVSPQLLPDESVNTATVISDGLMPFFGREIEFTTKEFSEEAAIDKVRDFAHYLLARGPIVKNGETFGGSKDEKLRVRYVPKGIRGMPVYRLTVEALDPMLAPPF